MHQRCPDCDRDGEVWSDGPGSAYITCPRCDGTKQIKKEEQPVNNEHLYQWLMICSAVLAGLCGAGAVGLIILCATAFSIGVLVCALLLAGGAVGSAWGSTQFASRAETPKVFNNQDEKEVLTGKQRRELKKARGDVVMQRAMIEVEQERENITHRAITAANDPDRPPHDTRWTESMSERVRMIGRNQDR